MHDENRARVPPGHHRHFAVIGAFRFIPPLLSEHTLQGFQAALCGLSKHAGLPVRAVKQGLDGSFLVNPGLPFVFWAALAAAALFVFCFTKARGSSRTF